MWGIDLNVITVFCITAITMFLISLAFMMLIVYMKKSKPQQTQSQGPPCNVVYAPTTIENIPSSPDVKPLLVNPQTIHLYPKKELEHLMKEEMA